jgi:hypothetical protein
MPTDLTVTVEDRPGTLADLGETLGKAGVNIAGGCGFACEGKAVIHILVEDAAAARQALDEADIEVIDERQVLVVDSEDKPGELGKIARHIAEAGVNIDTWYLSSRNQPVFMVDDLDKARAAI